MSKCLNKVCGVDVHKRFINATILSRSGEKEYRKFGTELDSLLSFKEWVLTSGCERVAFESTGVYWIPLYTVLEGHMELLLANARHIKARPGRKTDKLDSEWIAELCLNDQIIPSRVFECSNREFRWLTRHREKLVGNMTQCKNRIHKALQISRVKLSSVISDISGKTGMMILEGLLRRETPEQIASKIKVKSMRKKIPLIVEAIRTGLDQVSITLIRDNLIVMNTLRERIASVDAEIGRYIQERVDDVRIIMSMPGMGQTSASTILSEVGDYNDFETGDSLARWCGLTPSVYQSADHQNNGHITKQGSPHVRRIMVEVAHAASKIRGTKLYRFFNRIRAKKGVKVAIVALARKMLCIMHHLLVNHEVYKEVDMKDKRIKIKTQPSSPALTLEEMIECLRQAGFTVTRDKSIKGCT